MPEIKNNFTSGKMNKDLDERLLPKNEYRDALNIDIATTEGSDVGSAQNSYGNVKVSSLGITGAKCIGSVLNPENQKIIWFVSGTDVNAIAEYDQETQVIKPIVVDNTVITTATVSSHSADSATVTISSNSNIQEGFTVEGTGVVGVVKVQSVASATSIVLDIPQSNIPDSTTLKFKSSFLKFTNENLITGINVLDGILFFTDNNSEPKKINIDRFKTGADSSNPFSVTTKFVDANNIITSNNVIEDDITVVKQYPLNAPELELYRDIAGTGDPSSCTVVVPENTSRKANGVPFGAGSTDSVEYYNTHWVRTVDGAVSSTTVQFNNSDDSLTNSAYWNNVEVGMTFTNGLGEVTTSTKTSGGAVIGVSAIDNVNHRITLSGVPAGPILDDSVVGFRWALSTYQNDSFWKYIDSNGVKKLKPAGTVSNGPLVISDPTGQDPSGIIVRDINNIKVRTQKLVFNPRPNFIEGDIVSLKAPNTSTQESDDEVTIRIKLLQEDIWNDPVHSNQYRKVFNFKILSIDNDIIHMDEADLTTWSAKRETSTSIFEDKFPRFAYRWKYIDNEYSCISAFSEVAFLPTDTGYKFDAAQGTNTNIENTLSKCVLKNFDTIPKDVVSLDILIKFTDSPSIYKYKTLKGSDLETLSTYEVTSEQIHAMLPSNQILRPYDNVPKLAKAQEITANRLLYGNYTNQYDVMQEPIFELTMESHNVNDGTAMKSIKSLRTYQLGVTLLDKFGRQTPVYAQALNSTITPTQEQAQTANEFFVNNDFLYPEWATHIKYWIKEPKGEYYNITMDRVYEGETEDYVWLSIPSSDVNKVEEGDTIVLKKAHDTSAPIDFDEVSKTIKYNVLAKANSAPDAIKIRKNLIGRLENQLFGTASSPTTGYPVEGGILLRLRGDGGVATSEALSNMADTTSADRYIRIGSYLLNTVSRFYEVESIVKVDANTDGDFEDNDDYYDILLKKPFDNDINFTKGTTGGSSTYQEYFELFEQEDKDFDEEFQGRFFIKILKDDYLRDYVTTVMGSDGITYGITSTQKMYWIQNVYSSNDGNDETGQNGNAANSNALGYMEADFLNTQAHALPNVGNWGYNAFPEYFINKINMPGSSGSSANTITFDTISGAVEGTNSSNTYGTVLKRHSDGTLFGYLEAISGLDITLFDTQGTFSDDDDIRFLAQLRVTDWANLTKQDGDYSSPNVVEGVMRNGYTYQGETALNIQYLGRNVGAQRWGIDQAWSWVQGVHNGSNNMPSWENRHSGYGFKVGSKHVNFRIWNIGPQFNYQGGGYTFGGADGPSRHHITENFTLYQAFQKVGTKFRWADDPTDTVYTIVKYNLIDVNNYTTINEGNDSDFQNRNNQGIKFHIVLDKEVVWSPCQRYYPYNSTTANPGKITPAYGPAASYAETNTSEIQILVPVSTKQTFNSTSPAVFEVQPKESSDLNLYFETPQCSLILKDNMFVETSVIKPDGTIDTGVFDVDSKIKVINSGQMDPAFYIQGNDPWTEQNKTVEAGSYVTIFTKDHNGNVKFKQKVYIKNEVLAPQTAPPDSADDGGSFTAVARNNFYYKIPLNWFNCYSYGNGVESNRILDAFNAPMIDNGPRVSTTFEGQYEEETKPSGVIFSGIYNGASSVNNLNQFIMAEGITKDLNPSYGSIQKLYTRNTNVIAFCENKTLKILANKDALFNADGKTNVTATNKVLGQTVPFAGEFGISKNPESFASYGYRIYYTDKNRNAVLRLSGDGITNISDKGMSTFFKENLSNASDIIGSYDEDKDTYNLTLNSKTVSFAERTDGWTSLKSFLPENGFSVSGDYYTVFGGELYQHNANLLRNFFYGTQYQSSIKLIFNQEPAVIKNFNTLNYEGTTSRIYNNDDDDVTLVASGWYANSIETNEQSGQIIEFKEKEGKWFNNIIGVTTTDANVDTSEFTMQGLGTIPASGVSVGDGTHTTRYTHTVFAYAPESPDPTVTLVGGLFGYSGGNSYPTSESGNPAAIGQTHTNSGITINSAIKLTGTAVANLRYLRNVCEDLIVGETYTITADVTISSNNNNKTLGFGGAGISPSDARISATGVISHTWTATGSDVWFFKGKNIACVVDNISIVVTPQEQPRYPKFRINTSSNDATSTVFKTSVTNAADTTIDNDAYNGGNDQVAFYVHPLIVNGAKWAVQASGITVTTPSDPLNLMRAVTKTDGYLNAGTWTESNAHQGLHTNVVRVKIGVVGTMPSWNINSICKFVVTPTLTQS